MSSVTQSRYVSYSDAHYAGNLVDGAYLLRLFGEAITELAIRLDGDESLLASYEDVQFLAPVRAGDVVEVRATLDRRGRRSRRVSVEARILCRGRPEQAESAAHALADPVVCATAIGTIVVPAAGDG